jgi:hypothetical protein
MRLEKGQKLVNITKTAKEEEKQDEEAVAVEGEVNEVEAVSITEESVSEEQ